MKRNKRFNKLFWICGLPLMVTATLTISCTPGDGPTVNKYSVTFDLDGGSISGLSGNTMEVLKGYKVGQLPTPTKENARFSHWVNEQDQKLEGDKEITSNMVLKAIYDVSVPVVTGGSLKLYGEQGIAGHDDANAWKLLINGVEKRS